MRQFFSLHHFRIKVEIINEFCFRPKKPSKNGRIGAQELNFKISINVKLIIEIYDKNYTR